MVVKAFQTQRDRKFKLNPYGHYTNVLQEAFSLKENIDPNTLTLRKPAKRPKVDHSKIKGRSLNFG
jgi:hypothetical protein